MVITRFFELVLPNVKGSSAIWLDEYPKEVYLFLIQVNVLALLTDPVVLIPRLGKLLQIGGNVGL
ncbi:hypothetical protein [Chryseobacterium carnipullorum]|uniref:hypothetical protein n=1 Tax=Chryseobacterium carnipullorum TaxID=1124835 RepID=UPI001E2ADC2F|nr:hypothetical protein [Chryseobacterium carnipullorum]